MKTEWVNQKFELAPFVQLFFFSLGTELVENGNVGVICAFGVQFLGRFGAKFKRRTFQQQFEFDWSLREAKMLLLLLLLLLLLRLLRADGEECAGMAGS